MPTYVVFQVPAPIDPEPPLWLPIEATLVDAVDGEGAIAVATALGRVSPGDVCGCDLADVQGFVVAYEATVEVKTDPPVLLAAATPAPVIPGELDG
ncbi:MAG TPA: hypothetical protein VGG82_07710 [Casimicrobiaceae bacterium]|jgi:hypothetical protein